MKLSEYLQKFLPFGYLFLVILGILKESVFYYQMGVNILKYSSIMDILISPIADLTSHPIVLLGCLLYLLFLYLALYLFPTKNYQKNWVRKVAGAAHPEAEITAEVVSLRFAKIFSVTVAIGLFSFFLGIGLGNGLKISKRIASNNIQYDHVLTYGSDDNKKIYLIGLNSENYFYLEEGNNNIKISPVGAVKTIELLRQ